MSNLFRTHHGSCLVYKSGRLDSPFYETCYIESLEMAQRTKQPILQLKVRGPGVRTGRIAVPDLIRICQEAQNAVNRQAEAIEGRKTIHPGPITKSIQEECTLELVGIGRGSTTLKFALAHSQMKLDERNRSV